MNRCLHNWFSLRKHWPQPTLPLPPKITTLVNEPFFSVSALPGWSCLWAAQTLLGGIGCKSGQGLWQDPFTPAGIFPATSQFTSHHQHIGVGDQYMRGKGPRSTLRMAAEGGCPSQGSSSSLTLLPTPRLAEPSGGELYDLPCNSILLSGISRMLPDVSTAGKCVCFLVCMHEWDTSPLGWVKGTHSDQLYCTHVPTLLTAWWWRNGNRSPPSASRGVSQPPEQDVWAPVPCSMGALLQCLEGCTVPSGSFNSTFYQPAYQTTWDFFHVLVSTYDAAGNEQRTLACALAEPSAGCRMHHG